MQNISNFILDIFSILDKTKPVLICSFCKSTKYVKYIYKTGYNGCLTVKGNLCRSCRSQLKIT